MATEQELFWQGEFGDDYTERNKGEHILASNIALFSRILQRTQNVRSVLEFGAGVGNNLEAIKLLLPDAQLAGVEVNSSAAAELRDIAYVYHVSVLKMSKVWGYDFTLSKGLLIHIAPEDLLGAYEAIYSCSKRYICLVEYYNPVPVGVEYRGHKNKLFKRDFAGEMLEMFKDLRLIDYGFVYRRDNNFAQDDVHWWLMEK